MKLSRENSKVVCFSDNYLLKKAPAVEEQRDQAFKKSRIGGCGSQTE